MGNVSSNEVGQKFANAIEVLLDWIDPRIGKSNNQVITQEAPLTTMDRLLRVIEVAKILSISRSHTYDLVENKQIPSIRFGRVVRVRFQDLADLLQKKED